MKPIKQEKQSIDTVVKSHKSNMEIISDSYENAGIIERIADQGYRDYTKGKREISKEEVRFKVKSLKALRNTQLQQFAEEANKRLIETKSTIRLQLAEQSAEMLNSYIESVDSLMHKFNERLLDSEKMIKDLMEKYGSNSSIVEKLKEKNIERLISIIDVFYDLDEFNRKRLQSTSKEGIDPSTGDAL